MRTRARGTIQRKVVDLPETTTVDDLQVYATGLRQPVIIRNTGGNSRPELLIEEEVA
jgi:hypothetical protein